MNTTRDWTIGPDGRSNTSAAFEDAVLVVASLLRQHRLGDDVLRTARLVMAQLAHNHGFAPTARMKETTGAQMTTDSKRGSTDGQTGQG